MNCGKKAAFFLFVLILGIFAADSSVRAAATQARARDGRLLGPYPLDPALSVSWIDPAAGASIRFLVERYETPTWMGFGDPEIETSSAIRATPGTRRLFIYKHNTSDFGPHHFAWEALDAEYDGGYCALDFRQPIGKDELVANARRMNVLKTIDEPGDPELAADRRIVMFTVDDPLISAIYCHHDGAGDETRIEWLQQVFPEFHAFVANSGTPLPEGLQRFLKSLGLGGSSAK